MSTVSETLESIIFDLEGTADWRRRVLEHYPEDQRNASAASLLERLVAEITSCPDPEVVAKLSEIDSEVIRQSETNKSYDFSAVTMECNEYRRRIGFSEFPSSGNEYLQRLIEIYEEDLERAKKCEWQEYEPPHNPYSIFMDSYHHTGDILAQHGGDDGSHLINRMVFTQQLGALEAYLCDTLINAVMNNRQAMNRLLKNDKELLKEKFDLYEIAANPDFVTARVRFYLQSILYHNLGRVDAIYKCALGIDLFDPLVDRGKLHKAIAFRHDCVHRNGIDKDGKKLEAFTKQYVQDIADTVRALVEGIETRLGRGLKN